jgi:hypothetical protein
MVIPLRLGTPPYPLGGNSKFRFHRDQIPKA